MSYGERQRRREEAAAAVARFGELMSLIEEQARSRVVRRMLLDDIARIHGPLLAHQADEAYDEYEADLSARIASYAGDPALRVLMEAEMAAATG